MTVGVAHVEIARVIDVLADAPPAYADWLSSTEIARLAQLRHAARREHYLAGHWLARVLLARGHGGVPVQWQLLERRSQPPAVHGHESLHVSISHAGEWIAAAVADVAVGIDLEERTRVLDATLEPLLLEPDEAPGSLDAEMRLQRWVAKEAWLKRDGGSALPERLARIHLQSSARAQAGVVVDRHAGFVFGLALAPGVDVHLRSANPLVPAAAYAVVEA